jgi:hypothetical protein
MSSAGRRGDRKIEELVDQASESLARGMLFEAERIAEKALLMSRQHDEYERMAQIVPVLKDARRARLKQALSVGKVTVVDMAITEDMKVEPGIYLIQPPQVGSDARRLRLAAFTNDIPVAVLCREPLTKTRLIPIVAIGPGCTVRTKVKPPPTKERAGKSGDVSPADLLHWFVSALNELGSCAIEGVDPTLPPSRRVDALLDGLNAVPEHETLHDALAAACKLAATDPPPAGAQKKAAAPDTRPPRTRIKS